MLRHLCPIDGGVIRDAVKSRVCGHVFGLQCAIFYSIEHETCPTCGAAMDASDLQPHEVTRDEISKISVHCAEGQSRCQWVGPLKDEATHLNGPQCAVQRVDCPFCDKKGIEVGAEFERHKDVCEECVVICQKCCEDMPRRHLAAHSRGCTEDNIIEPLRRQKENLSKPVGAAACPSVSPSAKPLEEIDRDDDDDGIRITAHDLSSTKHVDVSLSVNSTCNYHLATACDDDDDFSPAPPPPATAPNTRHPSEDNTEAACATEKSNVCEATAAAAERAPCPLAALGCEEAHSPLELLAPNVLMEHLQLVATAFLNLKSAHEHLQSEHDQLTSTVAQQKKLIKMLEVRSALHSGKLQLPAGAAAAKSAGPVSSGAGLVDSPRVPLATQSSSVNDSAESPRGSAQTPAKRSTAEKLNRSQSSPAVTERSVGQPMFVPSVPKKKPQGLTVGASNIAVRRSTAAAVKV